MNISRNITLIRLSGNLNQNDFADKIGGTAAMIKSYESGKAKPKLHIAQRIAAFGGITAEQLLNQDLKEKDININADYKYDSHKDSFNAGLSPQNTGKTYEDVFDLVKEPEVPYTNSNKALLNLTEANKILAESHKLFAESNKKLAENNEKLISMVESNWSSSKQSPPTFDAKFAELLVAISEVASGEKKYRSSEEVYASLSKRFLDTLPKNEAMGIRPG